jgi:hypothetical protein
LPFQYGDQYGGDGPFCERHRERRLFEADCSLGNPLRDELIDPPIRVSGDGTISPGEKPGIGIEVDEAMIRHYAGVDEPAETGLRG